MEYEGVVYRPPSEAYSVIIQVTLGCSHNTCTFCSMFKEKQFRIRKLEDVFKDLETARSYYKRVERIFLADGDAMVLKTKDLEAILTKIQELFPECRRVAAYATSSDLLRKSEEELKRLAELGLTMIYIGIESGSDTILKETNKGATAAEMIEACNKTKAAGILVSATLISGLGGKEKWEEHAMESAKVINAIDPEYLGLLTLMINEGTVLYDQIQSSEFKLLTPNEVMVENKKLIENLELTHCVLRSNHVSNFAPLSGTLNKDKEKLLNYLDELIKEDHNYKSKRHRSY